jgi:RNA polymerase-binding transcription factor DksA
VVDVGMREHDRVDGGGWHRQRQRRRCGRSKGGVVAGSSIGSLIRRRNDMDLATQNHLTALRDLLLYRLQELRADVRAAERDRRGTGSDPAEVADRKDQAVAALASDIAAAEEERDVDEMEDVEAALRRLDHGTYGDCLACGESIPLQRLLVQPAARRCAACQAASEKPASLGR